MTQAKISADIASIVANSEEVGGPLDDLMTRFKTIPARRSNSTRLPRSSS